MKLGVFKILVLVSVLTMVFSIIGCTPTTTTTPSTTEPKEEVGTIKIGIIGPMKFLSGEHQWKGAALATEEINAAGGLTVAGKKYKFDAIQIDDNSFVNVPDAASAMQRAATVDGIKYCIGGGRTEAVLAQQEVAMDYKVLYQGISMSSPPNKNLLKDYERYKYYFNAPNCVSGDYIMQLLAITYPGLRVLKEGLGVDKLRIAYLAEKAVWADYIYGLISKVMPQMGYEIVGEWRPSHLTTDVSAEMAAIKAAKAHAIIEIFSAEGGTAVSRQWGELQIPAALIGVNVPAQKSTHWEVTSGLCNYESYFDWQFPIEITPKTKPYYAAFEKKYNGEFPTWTANTGYDGMYLFKAAFEKAGSFDVDNLVTTLEGIEVEGVTGNMCFYPKTYEASPHGIKFGPHLTHGLQLQWRDGKQIPYWPDGKELPEALTSLGVPTGWDTVQLKGMGEYVIPPWVIDYWKK